MSDAVVCVVCLKSKFFVAINLQVLLTEMGLFASLLSMIMSWNRLKSFRITPLGAGLALSLALVLLTSVPFAHALEIHHIFSAIDDDGHQHSDFDLCKWVQQHTSNSLVWDVPQPAQQFCLHSRLSLASDQFFCSFSSHLLHSRGPPNSLFF
jgi:hypothetical protein